MGRLIYDSIPVIKLGEIVIPKKLPIPDFIVRLPIPGSLVEEEPLMSIPTIKVIATEDPEELEGLEEPEGLEGLEGPKEPEEPEVISIHRTPEEIGIGCVTAAKGARPYMEDTYQVAMKGPYDFYAVYDGHGGSKVSIILQDEFHKYVFAALDRIPELRTESELSSKTINKIKTSLIEVFETFDKYLYENRGRDKLDITQDGSTATVVVDIGDYLIFANLGDSRSVFVRNGKVVFSTKDHKPLEEEVRIKATGSFVSFWGAWRVGGILGVSRAFGDFYSGLKVIDGKYKGIEAPVSVLPDITVIRKNTDGDDYVILASDGLWDVFSSEGVAINVDEYVEPWGVGDTCKRLVKNAIYGRGSRDNTTAMVFKVENP